MPQKSHHATDVTQEIYCVAGKRPPLRGTRERDRQQDRSRDRGTGREQAGRAGTFGRVYVCIWWLIMSPRRQTGRSPGSALTSSSTVCMTEKC